MAKLNAGNWGAFLNAVPEGYEKAQQLERNDYQNRYQKAAMVDPAERENQFGTENYNETTGYNNAKNGTNYQQFHPQGSIWDPVGQKLHGLVSGAADVWKSAASRFLPGQGQHAMGPSSQPTVPQATNMAPSPPGPSASNAAAPGIPGPTGPMPQYANGGPIPGRKSGGALRMRKAKPGNIAKPTKAAQAVMHSASEQAPVDAATMGAEGGAPRNTDAQPGNQDPMLANGGMIPKAKAYALPPYPKPNPKSVEQDINNDGQRNRLGKAIKRFADGNVVQPENVTMPEEGAGMRERSFDSMGNEQPKGPSGGTPLETARSPLSPKGLPGRAAAGARKLVNKAGPATAALVMGGAAAQNAGTDTDEYANRFGIDLGSNAEKAEGGVGQFAKQTGTRLLGYASDVGNDLTGGALRRVHDSLYPNNPWNGPPHGQDAPASQPQGQDITPVQMDPRAQHMQPTPGPAGAPGPQGPPAPPREAAPPPIDFSNVQVDHTQIPTTSTDEWNHMKGSIIQGMAAKGVPLGQAQMMADNQVSQFQHQNFMQYMQQGIALDAAGNKPGAMAALKTAYQYMPTGHDMNFGIDKKSGNIVGMMIDEKTGKPVGDMHLLDQKNLNGLLATYSDPKEFMKTTLEMQEQARKNRQTNAEVPYYHAHANLANAQAGFYNNRLDTQEEIARMRASMHNSLPVQSQKFYAQQLNGSIMDPSEQGDALVHAAQLESRYGNTPEAQAMIVGVLKKMYALPPQARDDFARSKGIDMNPQFGGQASQQSPYSMDMSMGYGLPPR